MKLTYPTSPGEALDLFEIFRTNRMIAHLWCVDDVQSEQAVDRSPSRGNLFVA